VLFKTPYNVQNVKLNKSLVILNLYEERSVKSVFRWDKPQTDKLTMLFLFVMDKLCL